MRILIFHRKFLSPTKVTLRACLLLWHRVNFDNRSAAERFQMIRLWHSFRLRWQHRVVNVDSTFFVVSFTTRLLRYSQDFFAISLQLEDFFLTSFDFFRRGLKVLREELKCFFPKSAFVPTIDKKYC